jgi:hypothetical protein
MASLDSTLDTAAIGRARALLKPPMKTDSLGPTIVASAFTAGAALALAFSVVMTPPQLSPGTRGESSEHAAPDRSP